MLLCAAFLFLHYNQLFQQLQRARAALRVAQINSDERGVDAHRRQQRANACVCHCVASQAQVLQRVVAVQGSGKCFTAIITDAVVRLRMRA